MASATAPKSTHSGELCKSYLVTNPIIDAAVIANGAEVTSTAIDSLGYNCVTFLINATRVAYTRLDVKVETSYDNSNWFSCMEMDGAVPPTVTLGIQEYQYTVSASTKIELPVRINAPYVRCKVEGISGTTDTCTVYAHLGAV